MITQSTHFPNICMVDYGDTTESQLSEYFIDNPKTCIVVVTGLRSLGRYAENHALSFVKRSLRANLTIKGHIQENSDTIKIYL